MIGLRVKNELLDTGLIVYQDTEWFKFSIDSVLLAQFVTLNLRIKRIIDFATGNAPIPMLMSFRTKALIVGVEYQKCIYELALASIRENSLDSQISLLHEDVNCLNQHFQGDYFDVVTCNPPYFKVTPNHFYNGNEVKSLARHEVTLTLDEILKQANFLLKNGGVFAMIHRTERFIEIIEKMKQYHLEPKRVQFIYPKVDRESDLFLIEGVKNGNEGLKLLKPLVVHREDNTYTDEILEMLEFCK